MLKLWQENMRLGSKQQKYSSTKTPFSEKSVEPENGISNSLSKTQDSVTLNTPQILFYQHALTPDISVQQHISHISEYLSHSNK